MDTQHIGCGRRVNGPGRAVDSAGAPHESEVVTVIEVRVDGVALDSAGRHVIILRPVDHAPTPTRIVPIWIGTLEAESILIALQGLTTPRPLAHELMRSLIDALGARVAGVRITRIEGGTYFASIDLETADGAREIDARPSDAVALATRIGATISIAEAVLVEAGVVDTVVDAESTMEEFTQFLDTVDPDDFRE